MTPKVEGSCNPCDCHGKYLYMFQKSQSKQITATMLKYKISIKSGGWQSYNKKKYLSQKL